MAEAGTDMALSDYGFPLVLSVSLIVDMYQVYFWCQRHVVVRLRSLMLPIDEQIPYWPSWVWVYSFFLLPDHSLYQLARGLAAPVHPPGDQLRPAFGFSNHHFHAVSRSHAKGLARLQLEAQPIGTILGLRAEPRWTIELFPEHALFGGHVDGAAPLPPSRDRGLLLPAFDWPQLPVYQAALFD